MGWRGRSSRRSRSGSRRSGRRRRRTCRADGLPGDDREEAFDEVEPAAAGWGEVDVDAGVLGQPRLDRGMLVGGVVVADEVQLDPRVGLGDLLEEGQELLVAVAWLAG